MAITRQSCIDLDRSDPLRHCRERFRIPDGVIYLDGNSLGALPGHAPERLRKVVDDEWGQGLIQSWNTAGWYELPVTLGDRLGKLIGAAAGQVVVCDNTSINLYKAIHAALSIKPDRSRIVADRGDFPTDLYVIEGAAAGCGRPVDVVLADETADPTDRFDEKCAVAVLSEVNYKSGQRLDMATVTRAAHAHGILVIWDLCHSAGAMPVHLDDTFADFAIGCTYKFLNGGPGAPAFVYAAARHQERITQPLQGWWSHHDPFSFSPQYRPAAGIRRMLSGTPPILSMQGVGYGLDTFEDVDLGQVRGKSNRLCEMFIALVQQECAGVGIYGPQAIADRGSHVALSFEHGYSVVQAMIAEGVIGDFRAPDLMRFGFAPLYVTFENLFDAVCLIRRCIEGEVWLDDRYTRRSAVT